MLFYFEDLVPLSLVLSLPYLILHIRGSSLDVSLVEVVIYFVIGACSMCISPLLGRLVKVIAFNVDVT
jgi:hypothetical protein